jgi:HEAT repeat protein
MATFDDLLLALSRAFDLTKSRSPGDPELSEALEDVREAQGAVGWMVARVGDDGLWVLGANREEEHPELRSFRKALQGADIRELRIQEVMEPEVLGEFLRRLLPSHEADGTTPSLRFLGLEGEVGLSFASGDEGPVGMAASIQGLFAEEDAGPVHEDSLPAAEGSVEPSPGAGATAPSPDTGRSEPSADPAPLSDELEEKVEAFRTASGPERARLAEEIREEGERLREERKTDTLTALVEALAGERARRGGEVDADVRTLLARLTTPGVASHLVARLGEARVEEERQYLIRLVSYLGEEMAVALADSLVEARDRYHRRNYMDALVQMGPHGLAQAERMVEDPRWFVVRNGVALLGEMGGEDAVSHVTSALANSDARVRQEAVRALGKLGGEDAGFLLLGMLDDQDPRVRATAARSVGVLRVEKALKPLIRMLEEDPDEDVKIGCIQAMGQIGDPGAVPVIEKRALGGLFSRPSREMRMAAYRALAAIGTPHARKLLEKASADSDPGVRTVVKTLLKSSS